MNIRKVRSGRRIGLGTLGRSEDEYYRVTEHDDGVLTLEPVVVMPKEELNKLRDDDLKEAAEGKGKPDAVPPGIRPCLPTTSERCLGIAATKEAERTNWKLNSDNRINRSRRRIRNWITI